jgi:type VI secretion system secreted protein VgrG
MGSSAASAVFPIQLTTPFGDGKLILRSIQGDERISGLFHYTLELISADDALDFATIVGQPVTVTMDLVTGDKEYLNGIVGRFVHAGKDPRQSMYFADVYPKLWLLTLASDCRIFQNMSVPDIVKQILSDHGVTDLTDSLTGTYDPREYCVQYMETDFDFINRLMEEEGIFYFHTHADGKHTLVLADDSSGYSACTGYSSVSLRPLDNTWAEEGTIFECSLEQQVVTAKYRTDDYNFEVPATDLLSTADGGDGKQVYQFPGDVTTKDAADARTKLVLESLEAGKEIMRGSGACRSFRAGAKFTLKDHTRDAANTDWVLRRVSFRGDQSVAFTNTFEAQPVATVYRPPRTTPKPRIYGAQTATVVGKSGEEIWTDEYGRIKVHFHWDQLGANDENDSCWVRVAQGWAGKQWGAFFLPRIGQEVVVTFLEGNPDRPLVTGSVYNATQTVPYTLPDDQTKSTIKSNSSKGGGGFNEFRFEDKKDSEEVYLHAQKDHKIDVLNDQTITVKNNRTVTVQEKDETLIVDKGNRAIKVNTGNETHEVKGTRDLTITGKETHTNKADYEMTVTGNFKLTVDGNITIESKGTVSIKSGTTFTNEAGTALTNKSGTDLKNEAGTSLTNKAGTTLENNAGATMTNKASASQTVDGGGMLTLKGGMVKIN